MNAKEWNFMFSIFNLKTFYGVPEDISIKWTQLKETSVTYKHWNSYKIAKEDTETLELTHYTFQTQDVNFFLWDYSTKLHIPWQIRSTFWYSGTKIQYWADVTDDLIRLTPRNPWIKYGDLWGNFHTSSKVNSTEHYIIKCYVFT
jgi:hypothetical protein